MFTSPRGVLGRGLAASSLFAALFLWIARGIPWHLAAAAAFWIPLAGAAQTELAETPETETPAPIPSES
ncbi:MAG: hypothetical protein AAGE52_31625, partial [Myxococcota bacterium]